MTLIYSIITINQRAKGRNIEKSPNKIWTSSLSSDVCLCPHRYKTTTIKKWPHVHLNYNAESDLMMILMIVINIVILPMFPIRTVCNYLPCESWRSSESSRNQLMTCSLGIQMLSLRRRHCKMIISLFCKDSDFCLPRTQNNVLPISGYHQCMFLCESEEVGKKLLFFRTPSDWSNLSRQLSVII